MARTWHVNGVWDGNAKDLSNFFSDKYLQVNSCGFQNTLAGCTLVRKKGRYDYHILLISIGICEVYYNGELHTLKPGNLVIYAPGEEQKYKFVTDCSSLYVHFTGSIVQEVLESNNVKSGVYYLKSNKTILDTFSNLVQRYNQSGREKYANASLLELIYNISDDINNEYSRNENIILPILTYINATYDQKITLDELAEKSGYSKSRFSHFFHEVTGTTPLKYQNEVRLNTACEMLVSTKQSISDIAHSCGFADSLYFSRVFKKRYNVSPSEYRETALAESITKVNDTKE